MTLVCRGIRGAITTNTNTKDAILEATTTLLEQIVTANELKKEYIGAAIFTTTSDLNATFPAAAARKMGWNHIALMCGQEIDVPESLNHCIRILLLVNTDKKANELVNVYLRDAITLRSIDNGDN